MGRHDLLGYSYESAKTDSKGLYYPCVVLEGVQTYQELSYLREAEDNGLYGEREKLPLFVFFDGVYKEIGNFIMDLDYVLNLKFINNYDIKIYVDADNVSSFNLSDGNSLLKFLVL